MTFLQLVVYLIVVCLSSDGVVCVRPGETVMTQFKATKYQGKARNTSDTDRTFTDHVTPTYPKYMQ